MFLPELEFVCPADVTRTRMPKKRFVSSIVSLILMISFAK
jgi:hypothetical protein